MHAECFGGGEAVLVCAQEDEREAGFGASFDEFFDLMGVEVGAGVFGAVGDDADGLFFVGV